MSLVPVTFTKSHPPYHEGEVAGFEEEHAAALVKSGVAKPYKKGAVVDRAMPSPAAEK